MILHIEIEDNIFSYEPNSYPIQYLSKDLLKTWVFQRRYIFIKTGTILQENSFHKN